MKKTADILLPIIATTDKSKSEYIKLSKAVGILNKEQSKNKKKDDILIRIVLKKIQDNESSKVLEILHELLIDYPNTVSLVYPGPLWMGKKSAEDYKSFLQSLNVQIPVFAGSLQDNSFYSGSFGIAPSRINLSAHTIGALVNDVLPSKVVHFVEKNDNERLTEIIKGICEDIKIDFEIQVLPQSSKQERKGASYKQMVEEKTGNYNSDTLLILSLYSGNFWVLDKVSEIEFRNLPVVSNIGPDPKGINRENYCYTSVLGEGLLVKESGIESFEKKIGEKDLMYLVRVDLARMVIKALKKLALPPTFDITYLRNSLIKEIKDIDGRKDVYKGLSRSFWFNSKQLNANTNLVLLHRYGSDKKNLARFQYKINMENHEVNKIPVVHLYTDVLKVDNINIENGTFRAVFYLDVRSAQAIFIDDIEINNVDYSSSSPIIEQLLEGNEVENLQEVHYSRYKIDAVLTFDQDATAYPFDKQNISLDFSSKNPWSKPLYINIAPLSKQDDEFDSPNWLITDLVQGKKTDFWRMPSDNSWNFQHLMRTGYSVGWKLKRTSTETILKTFIPMIILVILGYTPVLSKKDQLMEMTGILITCLLAAIALYFSLDKPSVGKITVLDRIFITSYIMIGGLMITSIAMIPFPENTYNYAMTIWMFLYPILGILGTYNIITTVKQKNHE